MTNFKSIFICIVSFLIYHQVNAIRDIGAATDRAFATSEENSKTITVHGSGKAAQGNVYIDDLARVEKIVSTKDAFAVLYYRMSKGMSQPKTLKVWGDSAYGGVLNRPENTTFLDVASNDYAFAAIECDETGYPNKLVAWGDEAHGGNFEFKTGGLELKRVVAYRTGFIALDFRGRIAKIWGTDQPTEDQIINRQIRKVVWNEYANAAVGDNGRVVAWGNPSYGGVLPQGIADIYESILLDIAADPTGFAVITSKASYTWTNNETYIKVDQPMKSLNSNKCGFVFLDQNLRISEQLQNGCSGFNQVVKHCNDVITTDYAAAAVCDGRIVAWGNSKEGELNVPHLPDIFYYEFLKLGTTSAFMMRIPGFEKPVYWGNPNAGGNSNSPSSAMTVHVSTISMILVTMAYFF